MKSPKIVQNEAAIFIGLSLEFFLLFRLLKKG